MSEWGGGFQTPSEFTLVQKDTFTRLLVSRISTVRVIKIDVKYICLYLSWVILTLCWLNYTILHWITSNYFVSWTCHSVLGFLTLHCPCVNRIIHFVIIIRVRIRSPLHIWIETSETTSFLKPLKKNGVRLILSSYTGPTIFLYVGIRCAYLYSKVILSHPDLDVNMITSELHDKPLTKSMWPSGTLKFPTES